jgi:hypothetical protein
MIAEWRPAPAWWVVVMLMPVNPAACRRLRYCGWVRVPFQTADLLLGIGQMLRIGAFVGGDVADAQAPAGPQDPEGFGEDACLVGREIDDAIGDDHVDLLARQRDVLDVAVQEAGVGDTGLCCAVRARPE